MAPETRSRGVAPPSRVYHSSPSLQQAQFPSRRKNIRTYGRQTAARLRQQTLTQIDFVSSFDGDGDDGSPAIVLTDSEDEVLDKENKNPTRVPVKHRNDNTERKALVEIKEPEVDQDEQNRIHAPASSTTSRRSAANKRKHSVPASTKKSKNKRRRTLGDDADFQEDEDDNRAARRRTMGDSPASSKYHTQTLTQFLGHRTLIADSDDDEPLSPASNHDQENGFLDWLGDQGSPSFGRRKTAGRPSPARRGADDSRSEASQRKGEITMPVREESVIPQTPVKRSTAIRFALAEEPSEVFTSRMDRYGPPNSHISPLKNRSSPAVSQPLRELTGTPRHLETTPTRRRISPLKALSAKKRGLSPKKTGSGREEIPDSDEEDGFDQESVGDNEQAYGAGVETQLVMNALASTEDQTLDLPCPTPAQPSSTISPAPAALRASSAAVEVIPSSSTTLSDPPTPKVLESPTPLRSSKPTATTRPIQKPLHQVHSSQLHSQPLESQRVPIAILQSLPSPGARSDILLPINAASLDPLLSGHAVHICEPFKIPEQVVRFWLLDEAMLRYMVCIEPQNSVRHGNAGWQYSAKQVYELNNPVSEDDMREEGWFDGAISKYVYLPPAVVGQLLWNLRHALFSDGSEEIDADAAEAEEEPKSSPEKPRRDDKPGHKRRVSDETPSTGAMTVSQQIAAQIHSDIAQSTQFIPSTPDVKQGKEKGATVVATPTARRSATITHIPSSPSDLPDVITTSPPALPLAPPRRPCTRPVPTPTGPTVPRPSQATTASQASTPEKPRHSQGKGQKQSETEFRRPPLLPDSSSGCLAFLDQANSYASVPVSSPAAPASQLLSRSQMLPETLLRDHSPPPAPEIWDSDSDDAPL